MTEYMQSVEQERLEAASAMMEDLSRWAHAVSVRQTAFLTEHGYTREEAKALPEKIKRRLNKKWQERLRIEGPTA